jgi:predicted nucleic acid-binding protein
LAAPNFFVNSSSKGISLPAVRPGVPARHPEIARQAGLLRRDWRKKGQTLSYTDVTIAAVALGDSIALLTDNRKHFPMPELRLLPLPDRVA